MIIFNNGIPLLHHAVLHTCEAVVDQTTLRLNFGLEPIRVLLYHGADLGILSRDPRREPALHVAVRLGKPRILLQLLSYGAIHGL